MGWTRNARGFSKIWRWTEDSPEWAVASKQFLTVTEPGGEPRLAVARDNGQVQVTLTGKQGSRYALETSTALTNWTSAALTVTVTNQSGTVIFPAPSATSGAQRFYRAVWQ